MFCILVRAAKLCALERESDDPPPHCVILKFGGSLNRLGVTFVGGSPKVVAAMKGHVLDASTMNRHHIHMCDIFQNLMTK